jgi:energy-coupling factor transporter transmembrane protein EcfT
MMLAFHYAPGTTALHRADPRLKLAAMFLAGPAAFVSPPPVFAGVAAAVILVLVLARIPVATLAAELRAFVVLLALIVGGRWLSDSLAAGVLLGLRFSAVVLLGVSLIATTTANELRGALRWALAPIPAVNAGRVSAMLSLMVLFVPLLLDELGAVRAAQSSRCGGLERNPLRRARRLSVTLVVASIRRIAEVTDALESRCYSDDPTPPAFRHPVHGWALVAGGAALLAGALIFPR